MNTSTAPHRPARALPTGTQHTLTRGDARVVVAAVGASLREYTVGGVDVVLPFAETESAPAYSGAVLAPWPNRLTDGEYAFDGTDYEVPVTEHARRTALHGLVAYVAFTASEHTDDRLVLEHTIVPTPGYPWSVHLAVAYTLDDEGLRIEVTAANVDETTAPYGIGFHPWLSPGDATVDECTLQVDADVHVTVDDRLLPTGTEPVSGTFDLRTAVPLRGVELDDAWVGVTRDDAGLSWIRLGRPDGRTVAMWADESFVAWQVCTGDGIPRLDRRGVAAEPMTCVADAFRTGTDLVRLEPRASHRVAWGLRLL
ncbi:galactose mutarotase [Cellulomonas algicola]|uniref:Galactose mutarotase n=1 Tax=Cellulomonas algicola TaxID=2071633 RepID=A0A401V458_9CELL|nr:aldose 1-epimerase family protein [Cellulomonas algicola]GCD21675.1 galactose mutarotase [Cellulomonas algicola]